MITGWTPPVLTGTPGTLDGSGDGLATFLSDPLLAPYVGTRVYVAVVSFDPITLNPFLSSLARTLDIAP